MIGLRDEHEAGGTDMDIKLPNGEQWKVHSPAMTEDDGAAKVLLRGSDDAVSLAEARFLVSLAEPGGVPTSSRPVALREASAAGDRVRLDSWMQLGDLEAVGPARAGIGRGTRSIRARAVRAVVDEDEEV